MATKLKVEEGKPEKLQNFSSSGARFQDVSLIVFSPCDLTQLILYTHFLLLLLFIAAFAALAASDDCARSLFTGDF